MQSHGRTTSMSDLSTFFNSWLGMYVAQSFLHSLVAALVVDTALIAWRIEDPLLRQRFRLIVIVVPLVAFPLYQAIDPERGSALFRLDALFDVNRWLDLRIWDLIPVGLLFLLLLVFTGIVFVLQEVLPIARHTATSGRDTLDVKKPDPGSPVSRALELLSGNKPEIFLLDDDEFVIFSSTRRNASIYVSHGLVNALSFSELQAAIAHEIGHIRRSRRPLMVLIFLLRVIMFYNPIVLMEFRRIVQEEEKICDDVAVELTGDRTALAQALRTFYYAREDDPEPERDALRLRDRIEEYGHSLLIETRIARLEEPPAREVQGPVVFIVVLTTVLAISYYLV
jgi:Zn-dependent protease with chaperone function